mgnify:CR=1 FL=1
MPRGRTPGVVRAGFTLIEVLAVLAITVMISGLAFPRIETAIARFAFDQTLTAVTANIRVAAAESLSTGKRVALSVAKDGHSYAWQGVSPRLLPDTVSMRQVSEGPIAFYADGSSTGGVLEVASGKRLARIAVDPITQGVSIRLQP